MSSDFGPKTGPKLNLLGSTIRKLIEVNKLSQYDIEKKSGIPRAAWKHWELGDREPDLASLSKIAAALDTTVPEIIAQALGQTQPDTISAGHNLHKAIDTLDLLKDQLGLVAEALTGQKIPEPQQVEEVSSKGAESEQKPKKKLRRASKGSKVLQALIERAAPYRSPAAQVEGQAAAGEGDQREYDADIEALHPDERGIYTVDAADPRACRICGDSGGDFARNGQVVIFDAAVSAVRPGEICLVVSGGTVRLKRKVDGTRDTRRYVSIDPRFGDLVLPAKRVQAEFLVVSVITHGRVETELETTEGEGPPLSATD